MRKKGFTLIELLAVIVILAIIALIATPIIMNVIEQSKKGSAERSAENYVKTVNVKIMREKAKGNEIADGVYDIDENGNLCLSGTTCDENTIIEIDTSGNNPSAGQIVIENSKVVDKLSTNTSKTTLMTVSDYNVSYDATKETYVAVKIEEIISNEPGLYAADGTMIATWAEFEKYGIDVSADVRISDMQWAKPISIIFNYKSFPNAKPYTLPNGETYNGEFANVSKIILPNTITKIGQGSFHSLYFINEIILPDSLTTIGVGAFTKTKLKTIAIPDGVTVLPSGDVDNPQSGIKGLFAENDNLQSITIPNSMQSIGANVFWECPSLTDIYYKGTKAEWDNIQKSVRWNYGCNEIVVHCIDEEIIYPSNPTIY